MADEEAHRPDRDPRFLDTCDGPVRPTTWCPTSAPTSRPGASCCAPPPACRPCPRGSPPCRAGADNGARDDEEPGPAHVLTTSPKSPTDDRGASAVSPPPCSTLRDGLPPVTETGRGSPRWRTALDGRHRAGGDRRRARLGLSLLLARLPDPAAPRGRGHLPGRPDRGRRPRTARRGTRGHRVDPARRDPGPPLPHRGRPAALRPVRHRAGRPPAGLSPGGLATLVEEVLGFRLRKEHSAVDWSTRPLPERLAGVRRARRRGAGRAARGTAPTSSRRPARPSGPARSSSTCSAFEPAVRSEPWRRTSGAHRVRGRRALGAVRALWEARDRDRPRTRRRPGPAHPRLGHRRRRAGDADRPRALLATAGFHGRGARRYAREWVAALDEARTLPESELPGRAPADRRPAAAARLGRQGPGRRRAGSCQAREAIAGLAEQLPAAGRRTCSPPTHLRRLLWTPPETRDPGRWPTAVADQLRGYGARAWQVELHRTGARRRRSSAPTQPDRAGRGPSRGLTGDAQDRRTPARADVRRLLRGLLRRARTGWEARSISLGELPRVVVEEPAP